MAVITDEMRAAGTKANAEKAPERRQKLIAAVESLIESGVTSPLEIAGKVGYRRTESLRIRLRASGRPDLAEAVMVRHMRRDRYRPPRTDPYTVEELEAEIDHLLDGIRRPMGKVRAEQVARQLGFRRDWLVEKLKEMGRLDLAELFTARTPDSVGQQG